MHGGAKGSGAPFGNKNAVKHGVFTAKEIERRARLKASIIQARRLAGSIGEKNGQEETR
jgi:uncharacterized protein YjcR